MNITLNNNFSVKQLIEYYKKISKEKEKNQQSFMKTFSVLNKKSGETFQLKYDLKTHYKKQYIDLIQNSIFIQNQSITKGLDTCLFITLTLNTQFHSHIVNKNNNSFIKNKNYDSNLSINCGYKKLNSTFRNIYKELGKDRTNREKIEHNFIKVFENHKDFTVHLHCLVFVNKENLEDTIKVIKNKINFTSEEHSKGINKNGKPFNKIKLNNDFNKNKGNEIGRSEIEILEDTSKGVGYLSKYIKKQFEENPYLLDGWKTVNKIRLVTTSYNPIPKYIYKKMNSFVDSEIKKKVNLLDYLFENTKIEYICENEKTIKLENKKEPLFKVKVYKKIKSEIRKYNYPELLEVVQNKLSMDGKKIKYMEILEKISDCDRDLFIKSFLGEDFEDIRNYDLFEKEDYSKLDLEDYLHLNNLVERFEIELCQFIMNSNIEVEFKEIENIEIFKNNELVYSKNDFEVYQDWKNISD